MIDITEKKQAAPVSEAEERIKIMLDATPLCCQLWDRNHNKIDCNEAAVRLFGFNSKQEYLERYSELYPEYQSDGHRSDEKVAAYIEKTFKEGRHTTLPDWTYRMPDGTAMPAEITLVRVKYADDYAVAVYTRDLREHNKMMKDIEYRDNLLRAVNHVAASLLDSDIKSFENALYQNMGLMAEAVKVDRMYVWENYAIDGQLYCTQLYEWSENVEPQQGKELTLGISYSDNMPRWEETLSSGKCINSLVRDMSPTEQAHLYPQGIVSILVVPVFIEDQFWGFVGFDDCHKERRFSENEEIILRSVSKLIANALIRNNMTQTMLEYQNELISAKELAEQGSRAKSDFLAKMSHDIRTPMNVITGMAELLLRGTLKDENRSQVQNIKQAASNLVSIINDIIDFSKIETGKMEIVPAQYLLSSLINDVASIIRPRLMEKPIRFFTNIDSKIPNSLIGDEVRLRQILLNLLSNAVKYTDKGSIGLTIIEDSREGENIRLKITVTDTGHGIKPEDYVNLFGDFVQVDIKKYQNIEGTGLGLAITKRLCMAMGGGIDVESKYGSGSAFTAFILQDIHTKEPFATVDEPDKKKVLVYERRTVYAKSISWSLRNMEIPHILASNYDAFAKALYRKDWFYVFSGYGLYEQIKPLMEQPDTAFPGGRRPSLALMLEWGAEPYIPNVRFISLPVQSLSIANVLNNKADSKNFLNTSADYNRVRFTFPQAKILIVDDISTNLKVGEGLLAPYQMTVDTCLSGMEAIELIKRHDYDLVFMDHMMPQMDGIETTAAVRSLDDERFKTLTIIALTANVVSGMKEIFLAKGFNYFLAKPIDTSKLDEILVRWIPEEKKQQAASNQSTAAINELDRSISGVDTARGLAMTGGTAKGYRQVLSIFRKDAQERLPLLQTAPEINTLPLFITQVHALKSASASIGAKEISDLATELETAGKAGNMGFIEKNLPNFVKNLTELVENIQTALELEKTKTQEPLHSSSLIPISEYLPLLHRLAAVLETQNAAEINRILDELNQKPLDSKSKEILEQISDHVLLAEYNKALKAAKENLES